MATFAEQLSAARKAANMTQEDLANALFVSRASISHWEKGRYIPDLETVRKLSELLHCTFETDEQPAPQTADDAGELPAEREGAPAGERVPAEPKTAWKWTGGRSGKRIILICSAVLILLLVSFFAFVRPLLDRNKDEYVSDSDGTVYYRIADFKVVTPREAGKAYITMDTSTETMQGDAISYWMYTFTMREDNGVDFHIEFQRILHAIGNRRSSAEHQQRQPKRQRQP